MNWLESIEEAIDYIESHLKDDFSVEDVASHVYMSSGYFQKAFSMLCGFTVSEYIRNRRLAEAGMELLSSNEKIIDIALMYGYDSHDSFTKAFSRFHGVTPSAVRRGGCTLKAFAPLRLHFILGGGYIMDYRIEKQPGFEVLLKVEADRVTYWSEPDLNENQKRMISTKQKQGGLYREVSSDSEHLEGFELHSFPAATWAVFVCKGSSRVDAREKTFNQITKEWFPQTNYRLDNTYSVMISYQTRVNQENDDDLGVYWVPIVEE